jgi:signal transduction histidine kinase
VKEWNEAGEPLLAIGVVVDRTELRALQDQLNHSEKLEALGRMAGSVAHDFNNMISVISGYAEMLKLSLPDGAPLRDHVEAIHAAAGRAAEITQELLAFSRSEPAHLQVLDLNEVIRGVAGMLRHLAGQDVELELQLYDRPVKILAGKSQLEQILVNLALNAGDAMSGGGGILTLCTELPDATTSELAPAPLPGSGPQAMLTVRDTGAGMDEETLAHLFEPFFTKKRQGKGTGLGLARTPVTLQEWGGAVCVRSQPGVGTIFYLRFPQAEGAAETLSPPP